MEGFNVNLDIKNLRKAAFAVGFGITVGKTIGDIVSAGINGMVLGLVKCVKESSQKACKKDDVEYAEEEIGNDPRQ